MAFHFEKVRIKDEEFAELVKKETKDIHKFFFTKTKEKMKIDELGNSNLFQLWALNLNNTIIELAEIRVQMNLLIDAINIMAEKLGGKND